MTQERCLGLGLLLGMTVAEGCQVDGGFYVIDALVGILAFKVVALQQTFQLIGTQPWKEQTGKTQRIDDNRGLTGKAKAEMALHLGFHYVAVELYVMPHKGTMAYIIEETGECLGGARSFSG